MRSSKLDNSAWKNAILNMKKEMKFQNKALKTERSYIYWVKKFNAILFLFRHILDKQIHNLDSVVRSKVQRRLPLVLSQREVSEIIKRMGNPYRLMTEIIYGGGLRLSECLRLRI